MSADPLMDIETATVADLREWAESDRERFSEIFQHHFRPKLRVFAARRCRPPLDPEDIVQTTVTRFLHCYVSRAASDRHALSSDSSSAKAILLLYSTCRHLIIDAAKELSNRMEGSLEDVPKEIQGSEDPFEAVAAALMQEQVKVCLGKIPKQKKELIQLRIFEGLDYRSIAERLGCCPQTAHNHVTDAIRRLRLCVNPTEDSDERW